MWKRITILASILTLILTVGVRADLEGYWKFDEGSGNTVSDSSGNGRNGTISGAAWHAGGWDGSGWSLDFDGVNDIVELGKFDVAGPGITLAAWIRPDDFEINGSRIISKANEYGDNDHWWMLGEYQSGGHKLRFRLKTDEGAATTTLIAGSGVIATGQWQHTAATWDGVTMRVYLDGVQTGSVAKGGSAVATNPNVNVAIGSQPSNAYNTDPSHVVRFFDGLIDEVRIYNEGLSAADIQDLANGVIPVPRPANDDCTNAEAVGNVSNHSFNTIDASFDGPGLCMTSPNIWYRYTATCTGNVTVSLAGSSYDTMLAVYQGSNCYPNASRLIECNDDAGSSYQSAVTFAATSGAQYLIEIGGYGSATGQGKLTINCQGQTPPPPPPVNKDNCSSAQAIGNVTDQAFDTTNATFDGPGHCMNSPNIWYLYTATCTGDVTVSLLGSSYDTKLAVYSGASCYPAASALIECNDDYASSYQSQITFAGTSGQQYLIEVGGYGSAKGQGKLTVSCTGATPTQQKPDLGDAPDSTNNLGKVMHAYTSQGLLTVLVPGNFPTVYDDLSGIGPRGPAHVNNQVVAFLGKKISAETEADKGLDEDGGNNIRPLSDTANRDDGDDSVVFPLNLPNCGWTNIQYTVTVVTPGTDLWVNVWLDFNRDGDWDDTLTCPAGSAPEWAVKNQFLYGLPAGLHTVTTPAFLAWNPAQGAKDIWMRVTLSERPWKGGTGAGQVGNGGSGPQARYNIGETEDYFFVPQISDSDCPLCVDFNGDGVIDIDDLAAITAEWLVNCQ